MAQRWLFVFALIATPTNCWFMYPWVYPYSNIAQRKLLLPPIEVAAFPVECLSQCRTFGSQCSLIAFYKESSTNKMYCALLDSFGTCTSCAPFPEAELLANRTIVHNNNSNNDCEWFKDFLVAHDYDLDYLY